MPTYESMGDLIILINGGLLLFLALVFLQLYRRYNRRDYFILTVGFLAGALQMIVDQLEIISSRLESDILEFVSAIFSMIMILLIIVVLAFPERLPIEFEKELLEIEAREDD